jgi:hypothetical protein
MEELKSVAYNSRPRPLLHPPVGLSGERYRSIRRSRPGPATTPREITPRFGQTDTRRINCPTGTEYLTSRARRFEIHGRQKSLTTPSSPATQLHSRYMCYLLGLSFHHGGGGITPTTPRLPNDDESIISAISVISISPPCAIALRDSVNELPILQITQMAHGCVEEI